MFSSTTIYASVKLWCSLRAQLKEVPVPARCSDPTLARRIQLPWELTMVSKFYYETRSSPSSGLTMLIVKIYLGPPNKMFEINLPEPFHCVHPDPCEQGWSLNMEDNKYSRHGLHIIIPPSWLIIDMKLLAPIGLMLLPPSANGNLSEGSTNPAICLLCNQCVCNKLCVQ